MKRSFCAAGCCGAADRAGAWLAGTEGRGGFAPGSGDDLLAVGLLGEEALAAAAFGGVGGLAAVALLELHGRADLSICNVLTWCVSVCYETKARWADLALNDQGAFREGIELCLIMFIAIFGGEFVLKEEAGFSPGQ